jgi:hypothetical protein
MQVKQISGLVVLMLLTGCGRWRLNADCNDGAQCRRQAQALADRSLNTSSPEVDARMTFLFQKGCELGDASSCTILGGFGQYGVRGPVDLPRAARFYDKGCTLKDAAACSELAQFYGDGRGVPKDPALELKYRQLSCGFADRMTRETFCEWDKRDELPKTPSPPGPGSVGAGFTPTLGNIGTIGKSPGAVDTRHHHRPRSPDRLGGVTSGGQY